MDLVNPARHAVGRVFPSLSSAQRDPAGDFVRLGLFDLEYYRAQLSASERPASLADARRHYECEGRDAGLAMHPFIEPEWWDPHAATDDEDAVGRERWLVHGGQAGSSTSVLIAHPVDGIGTTREYLNDIIAGKHRALLPAGLSAAAVVQTMTERIRGILDGAPNDGVRSAVDWAAVTDALPHRVTGRVSVLVPTYQDWRMTVSAIRAALEGAGEADVEVVVIDNGSRLSVVRSLVAVFLAEPRVRIFRCDVNTNFAGGMNRAIAESTGEYVVLLNNDAELESGWLDLLVEPLRADSSVRGTQPLLMYPGTNRIQAAGTMFAGEGVLPWHFLAGHPREDAARMTELSFRAVTAAVMAVRARDIVAQEGFDEEFENGYEDVDLCLRLLSEPGDRFLLVREAAAYHPEGSSPGRSLRDSENRRRFFDRWAGRMPAPEPGRYADIGLRLDAMRPLWFVPEVPILATDPQLSRPARVNAQARPCLRWLLVADASEQASTERVRRVLDGLGQEVVTVTGGTHWSDALADVVVGIGADAPTFPRAGTFNVAVAETEHDPRAQAVSDGGAESLSALIPQVRRWNEERYPAPPA